MLSGGRYQVLGFRALTSRQIGMNNRDALLTLRQTLKKRAGGHECVTLREHGRRDLIGLRRPHVQQAERHARIRSHPYGACEHLGTRHGHGW